MCSVVSTELEKNNVAKHDINFKLGERFLDIGNGRAWKVVLVNGMWVTIEDVARSGRYEKHRAGDLCAMIADGSMSVIEDGVSLDIGIQGLLDRKVKVVTLDGIPRVGVITAIEWRKVALCGKVAHLPTHVVFDRDAVDRMSFDSIAKVEMLG